MKLNLIKPSIIALVLLLSNLSFAVQERVVAIVDGNMIMESQVIQSLGNKTNNKKNRSQALEAIIDDYLVQKAIKESGAKINDAIVDQEVENMANRNGLTYGQLLDVLDEQGIPFNQYKKQLAHQMIMAQVQQFTVSKLIQVDPKKVQQLAHKMLKKDKSKGKLKHTFAKQYRISHILVKLTPVLNDKQAQQQLEKITSDIRSGKITFEEAARKNSKDYASAIYGGDLSWNFPQAYDPRFAKQVESTKVGKISKPFKSKFGWHILKITDTRKQDATKDVYLQKAYAILVNNQAMTISKNWIKALRKNVQIKYVR